LENKALEQAESLFSKLGGAAIREQSETLRKTLKGAEMLREMRRSDLEIGTAPKELVYREGHLSLYRYLPAKPAAALLPPTLIVYSLVNRYYMIDLQPDRSLVRRLLDLGADLYVIDWGYPTRADRWTTMEDHIGYLGDCVEVVCERHGLDRINVLGVCQGGFFSLCYSALYPERVRNLITMVTPIDFELDDTLMARVARHTDADRLVDTLGNVPGSLMHQGFLMRSPFAQNVQKYADLVDLFDDRDQLVTFLRMEKWVSDSPDHPGETFRKWIKDGYQENKLIKGTFELDGRAVSLGDVRAPVLNLYGERDDIVEPASSAALAKYVGTEDYTARSFPVGHIGMYVSSKVQRDLPPTIADWLAARC
jgi:polyhydroxyalkanoate synthase